MIDYFLRIRQNIDIDANVLYSCIAQCEQVLGLKCYAYCLEMEGSAYMDRITVKQKDLYNISPLLEGVMNLAFDEACIMDKDGYIIWCSESSPLIWGRPNEESLGMHISELDSASPYPELLRTGKAVMGKIHIINGRTCVTHMIPLFDKNNHIMGAFGVIIFRGIEKLKKLVKDNALDDGSMKLYHQITRAEANYSFDDFLTQDPKMKKIIYNLKRLSLYKYPILISGETGTGKEILANGIHTYRSKDHQRPFIRINCNAIPAELLESELFGHEKGAYTFAQSTKVGKFELAGDGTILLDEIGGLNINVQSKLLRVIEEQEFERVGGSTLIPLRARIIASTNCDIQQKIREGMFRDDLYYRLSAFEVKVPPLRERGEDVEVLAHHFLKQEHSSCTIAPDAMEWLKRYRWPGNVRQLKNTVTRIAIIEDTNIITRSMVKAHLNLDEDNQNYDDISVLRQKNQENGGRTVLLRALEENKYNISAAARALGISRNTMYNRMKKYDFPDGKIRGRIVP